MVDVVVVICIECVWHWCWYRPPIFVIGRTSRNLTNISFVPVLLILARKVMPVRAVMLFRISRLGRLNLCLRHFNIFNLVYIAL